MRSPATRLLFATVLVATLGAFIATQRLKGGFPFVLRFATQPVAFSPNGDGVRDTATVGFDLTRDAVVSFRVIDAEGREVRELVPFRRLPGDVRYRFRWDGRDDDGRRVPDGIYRLRVIARDEGRVVDSIKELVVDTKPPAVHLVAAKPALAAPGEPVTVRYAGPANRSPEFFVFRSDHSGRAHRVARFRGHGRTGVWDGRVGERPAPPGHYAFTVRVRDRAGNERLAPARAPTAQIARAGTGVTVTRLAVTGPVVAVRPGTRVRFAVAPTGAREGAYRVSLRRAGSAGTLRRFRAAGSFFRLRVPVSARTGLYVVTVQRGRVRASWPLAVEGTVRGGGERRLLVVVPLSSWQAANPADGDSDGFVETIGPRGGTVSLARPFARIASEAGRVGTLVRLLERARFTIDIATDVELERGRWLAAGRSVAGAIGPSIVVAGSLGYAGAVTRAAIRRHVAAGGAIAFLGRDSLHRSCAIVGERLECGERRPADVFGALTSLRRYAPAPLAVQSDTLGVFRRVDRLVGLFDRFEVTRKLPTGARTLSVAAAPDGATALVAYRYGRGLVVQAGVDGWLAQLVPRSFRDDVRRVTISLAGALTAR